MKGRTATHREAKLAKKGAVDLRGGERRRRGEERGGGGEGTGLGHDASGGKRAGGKKKQPRARWKEGFGRSVGASPEVEGTAIERAEVVEADWIENGVVVGARSRARWEEGKSPGTEVLLLSSPTDHHPCRPKDRFHDPSIPLIAPPTAFR